MFISNINLNLNSLVKRK